MPGGTIMNTTHTPGYTTVRDIWHNLDFYGNKIGIPVNEKLTMEKIEDIAQWLLQAESTEDLPQPAPGKTGTWANAGKAVFWIATAIGVGFLIAQLSS